MTAPDSSTTAPTSPEGADAGRCPICDQEGTRIVCGDHPAYRAGETHALAACAHCDTTFVTDRTVEVTPLYEAIYAHPDAVPGYDRYARFAEGVRGVARPLDFLAERELTYWAVRAHLAARGDGRTPRILEIGSGLGYLTFALHRAGFDVRGIDLSATAVATARERYGDLYEQADLFEWADGHAGRYDLVVMTEVIEHLPDVYPFLGVAQSLLAPGGDLLVTTPNKEEHAASALWETEAPPVHFWWFSPASFHAMARRLGSTLDFVDLRAHPAARTWAAHPSASPGRPTRHAVLSAAGVPLAHESAPRPPLASRPLRRAWGRLRREVAGSPFQPLLTAVDTLVPRPAWTGPPPTLCALFRRPA